jgi:hypothetical protein
MKNMPFRAALATAGVAAALLAAPAAFGQSETFRVISVDTTGCSSGQFGMTVERANLDGGSYIVHTVVTVNGLIYMNEEANISVNGTSGWNIFNNFTYGAVANPGTYPIPSGQPMRLDFTLERPKGTVLFSWALVVDGCSTGTILYNGPPEGLDGGVANVPSLSAVGLAILALAFAALGVARVRALG